ncbi:MAG: alpha-amylase, partial [Bacteroidetes bacterium]|nr:alpha-amylase [Bacteroidota bacterium]
MSQSLSTIDFKQLTQRAYTASPAAWEDRVFYFILLDRFSDGREAGFPGDGTTPLYNTSDESNAIQTPEDALAWRTSGTGWVGGNFKGVRSKLAYLADMGVSALWISPVFKQVSFVPTYHGYGIQDFLEVDEHFGKVEDLRDLVDAAHALGIAVILDIVLNHSGNVFSYDADRYPVVVGGSVKMQPRWDGKPYTPKGFNDSTGKPAIDFSAGVAAGPDDAVWPVEFRNPDVFTQKGQITNWDYDPEYLQGDFFDLKDIHLGQGEPDSFVPSPGLLHLVTVYKYWIGLLDIDGYRIDTVKHMETGAVRYFAVAMHEFAQTLGKDQFFLVGEITGDRAFAFQKLQATGLNAALGIADVQDALGSMVKGKVAPEVYFDLFRNSLLIGKGTHTWFRDKVVVMVDDHDKINQGDNKYRFCARDGGDQLIRNAIGANLMTLGIPCIYYGSEQSFDGQGSGNGADEYIREAMFGGAFGAFRSKGLH